jgi:hypothetical protein
LKESEDHGKKYKVSSNAKNKGSLETIVNNLDERKGKGGKKKEDCKCGCIVY